MATVSEVIPEALQPEVEAALAWFNAKQEHVFDATGILDPDLSLAASEPRELRLVLCGGDLCQQRSFRVTRNGAGFDVEDAASDEQASGGPAPLQAELDPPPGPRRAWLDSALASHEFVVLLFYRGFW